MTRSLPALLAVASAASPTTTRYELRDYVPAADYEAEHVVGEARFTVLSPQLIRMEYKDGAWFEDRATLAFVNRRQPVPPHRVDALSENSPFVLTTSHLKLTYAGGPFTSESLQVEPAAGATGAFKGWKFGMTSAADPGNLRGTYRTLDKRKNVTLDCNANGAAHCEWGVVSRSGWALVNETGVPCLDSTDDWWADASGKMLRNADAHDLYLFAHGHDYKAALRDLTAVGGQVPLLPRRNLGVWFTRWYDYDAADVEGLVGEFEARTLPLDILILDMNWHKKDDWTGYSWDPTLFPAPRDTTGYLHSRGIAVGANLHDASGVNAWEDTYAAFASALGLSAASGARINMSLTNKSYVFALEDVVVHDVEKSGMDLWWIDWQQGETQGGTGQDGRADGKMNPTVWTAKMRVTDSLRRCRQKLPSCERARATRGAQIPVHPVCTAHHRARGTARARGTQVRGQARRHVRALGRPRAAPVPARRLGRPFLSSLAPSYHPLGPPFLPSLAGTSTASRATSTG